MSQNVLFAHEGEGLAKDIFDDLREVLDFKDMFLGSDVIRDVIGAYRSTELSYDLATVNLAADPMDRHAGLCLTSRLDRFMDMMAVHPHSPELRKQGWMEVDHPAVIFMNQEIRDDQQEAGQHDEVY